MVATTAKVSKLAIRKALKVAKKTGAKAVIRVPNQTGRALVSMLKSGVKTALGAGILYGLSETFKTVNRESFNCFTGDVNMLVARAKNSVRD